MVTNYIGADVDCKMTELAVERKGKIIARDRVPTDIKSLSNFLDSFGGRKEMVVEEGPSKHEHLSTLECMVAVAGWLQIGCEETRLQVERLNQRTLSPEP